MREKRRGGMEEKLRGKLEEIEKTIKLLEIQFAKIKVKFAAGEISEETYEKGKETFERGLSLLKNELKQTKEKLEGVALPRVLLPRERIEIIIEELPMDRAFYFYLDYGKYTGKYARSLEEFAEMVKNVESASLRFHLSRGDFQTWIRDLGDPELAVEIDELKKLELDDEELGKSIHQTIKERLELLKRGLKTAQYFG